MAGEMRECFAGHPGIIPGDWGKVGPGWLVQPLWSGLRFATEAGFTSSSGGVRALSVNAKKELSGKERLETATEPSQVLRAGFEPGRIAVTQRV